MIPMMIWHTYISEATLCYVNTRRLNVNNFTSNQVFVMTFALIANNLSLNVCLSDRLICKLYFYGSCNPCKC